MADCPKYRYVDSWTQTVLNVFLSDYRGYTPVQAEYVAWQVTVNSINFGPWASADIQVEGLDDLGDVRQSFEYTCLATDTYPKTFGTNSLGGATVQLRYYIQVPVNHVGSPISWDFEIQFIGDCPPQGWYAWGDNSAGVLGVGDTTSRPQTPTPMLLPHNVSEVGIGYFSGLGIQDGVLYAWGDNGTGQLGLPSTPSTYPTPTVVSGMANVIQVAASASYSTALKSDGTYWCTGRNVRGQFGNGSTSSASSYTWTQTTTAPPNIARIWSGDQTTAIIDADGQLWMAGWRQNNIIPDGITSPTSPANYSSFYKCTLVPTPIRDFALAGQGAIALYDDGTVYVWGHVANGRAGDGVDHPNLTRYSSPIQVPGLSNIVAVAASIDTYHALDNAGRLWSWGDNFQIEGGIASATVADQGNYILSPTRWSNATSLTVEWIGQLGAYAQMTAVKGTDGKYYGSGNNQAPTRGLICRDVEQPPGTAGWLNIPGPTNGYPELGMPIVIAYAPAATISKWGPAPPAAVSIPSRLATIVG